MKLKTVLQLQVASAIVDEALRIARVENMMPLTVAVLDAGGKLVASKSEDGSGLLRHDVAFGKAWRALGMGVSGRKSEICWRTAILSRRRWVPLPMAGSFPCRAVF